MMRALHSAQSGSGLCDGSLQRMRMANSWPSCMACTQSPSTRGSNQRGLTMICPTIGMYDTSTPSHAGSSADVGSAASWTSTARMTSSIPGAFSGARLRT